MDGCITDEEGCSELLVSGATAELLLGSDPEIPEIPESSCRLVPAREWPPAEETLSLAETEDAEDWVPECPPVLEDPADSAVDRVDIRAKAWHA